MKICVIGAGISGLSIARMLKNEGVKVEVLEKSLNHGGIARTRDVEGNAYHTVGGHCFNSKHPEVLDFVFNEIMPVEQWNKVKRKADIYFRNRYINYPIEYSMKQIFEFDNKLAIDFIGDFLSTVDSTKSTNLKEWFINNFGRSLSEEYFIPYNEKIWGMKTEDMSPDWVTTKLPLPDKGNFIKGLLIDAGDNMPHATFYYPKTNNQNTFIENLALGCEISYGVEVSSIEKVDGAWLVNDELKYDIVINTAPLDCIGDMIKDFPLELKSQCSKLKYNKVTTMLWKRKPVESTWSYFPEKNTPFHRHIHIGNFFKPKVDVSITEAMGSLSYKEMVAAGEEIDYLIEPLSYNVSERAYVVFDKNYDTCRDSILKYLDSIGMFTLGRFGEWEYYNMDICIKSALELAKRVIGK